MRHLVIGLGSIGKRHKRLLEEARETVIGVDKGDPIDWDVAMVWICTPTDTHWNLAEDAISKGIKRIFIEKPVTSNIDEANDLKVQNTDVRIWIAQNMRFHPRAIAIKENLSKVGKIHYARFHFGHALANQVPNRVVKEGIVMDCIQWIDLALWLFGPRDSKIKEHAKPIVFDETIAKLWLIHASGVHSFIDLDFIRQDKSCGIEVIGEKGTLRWLSYWKSPERGSVSFLDSGGLESFDRLNPSSGDNRLDPDVSYKAQLKYLLTDQWQSNVEDQIAAMEVALG